MTRLRKNFYWSGSAAAFCGAAGVAYALAGDWLLVGLQTILAAPNAAFAAYWLREERRECQREGGGGNG